MRPLTVLVVDDNPDSTDVAELILRTCGHQVSTRFNGQEGLDAILAQAPPFDLVLLDVAMPVMDGLTMIRRLRASEQGRDVPVVCVSAKASGAREKVCLAAGADAFLEKPYRRRDLLAVIDRVLIARGVLKTGESIAG